MVLLDCDRLSVTSQIPLGSRIVKKSNANGHPKLRSVAGRSVLMRTTPKRTIHRTNQKPKKRLSKIGLGNFYGDGASFFVICLPGRMAHRHGLNCCRFSGDSKLGVRFAADDL